jgi:hypothetical protein
VALHIAREEHDGSDRTFTRVAFSWHADGRDAELVLEPGQGEELRVRVRIGDEHEEHELGFHAEAKKTVNAQSKLISIEDTRGRQLAVPRHRAVRQQSQLITIEDTGRSLPEATIVLP